MRITVQNITYNTPGNYRDISQKSPIDSFRSVIEKSWVVKSSPSNSVEWFNLKHDALTTLSLDVYNNKLVKLL